MIDTRYERKRICRAVRDDDGQSLRTNVLLLKEIFSPQSDGRFNTSIRVKCT